MSWHLDSFAQFGTLLALAAIALIASLDTFEAARGRKPPLPRWTLRLGGSCMLGVAVCFVALAFVCLGDPQ